MEHQRHFSVVPNEEGAYVASFGYPEKCAASVSALFRKALVVTSFQETNYILH